MTNGKLFADWNEVSEDFAHFHWPSSGPQVELCRWILQRFGTMLGCRVLSSVMILAKASTSRHVYGKHASNADRERTPDVLTIND